MADVWLPIRPGTDVALMMTWIRYIIENKLYDEDFCKRWTNLPYLIDTDTKKMLRAYEVGLGEADAEDAEKTFVVWDQKTNSAKALPWPYDEALDPAFFGTYEIDGVEYPTAFTLLQERVDEWTLEKGCEVCCLEKDQVEKAIRIYAENAPSGLVLGVATDMSLSRPRVRKAPASWSSCWATWRSRARCCSVSPTRRTRWISHYEHAGHRR